MDTYKKIKATVIDSKLITTTTFTIKTTKPVDFTFEATQFTVVGIRIKNKEFSPGRFPFPWLIQEAGMDYRAMSIAS